MTITSTSAYSAVTGTKSTTTTEASGFASLGQADFLKLMTVQMQQQDPFNPVDQKEMLAQMAQFSSLAGQTEMGETLKDISSKLDAVLKAQGYTTTTDTTTDTTTGTGTGSDTTSQEN